MEAHLRLLRPRELEALGVDSLKNKQFEAAIKYLNLSRLDWNEALLKRSLETGTPAEVRMGPACLASYILGTTGSSLHIGRPVLYEI